MMNSRFLVTIGLSFAAFPGLAQVSPADVWSLQQKQFAESGMEVAFRDVETLAGRVTVRGLSLVNETDDEMGGSFGFGLEVGDVTYRGNSDGTVSIEWPENMPFTFSGSGPDGSGAANLNLSLVGLTAVASGVPGDITTAWDAPRMEITAVDVVADGEPLDFDLDFVIEALVGTNRLVDGDVMRQISDFTADALTVSLNAESPEGSPDEGSVNFAYDMSGLSMQSDGAVFQGSDVMGFGELIEQGLNGAGSFSYTGSKTVLNVFESGAPLVAYLGDDAGGAFELDFGADGIGYSASSRSGSISVASRELPLPQVDLSYEEVSFGMQVPLIPSEEAQNFGLRMRFAGLSVSDLIWSMIDPTGQISREPATLEVNVSGTGNLFVDITDPEAMEEFANDVPGQVDTLSVNAIELALAGARLTGSGEFAVDNSGVGPFAPAPTPVGSLNMKLTGGNALLDRLITMGLLPEDQAMGFRMMLGLFARPGDGPDTLVSTIEVTSEGAVLANGQRIR